MLVCPVCLLMTDSPNFLQLLVQVAPSTLGGVRRDGGRGEGRGRSVGTCARNHGNYDNNKQTQNVQYKTRMVVSGCCKFNTCLTMFRLSSV